MFPHGHERLITVVTPLPSVEIHRNCQEYWHGHPIAYCGFKTVIHYSLESLFIQTVPRRLHNVQILRHSLGIHIKLNRTGCIMDVLLPGFV